MLATTDLLDHLKEDPEASWATYGNTGLTPVRLDALLRDFDVTSSNLRLGKDRQAKGYRRADFADAWARYCPPEVPQPSQPSHPKTAPEQAAHPPATVGRAPLPLTCRACHQPMAVDDGTHVHPTCEKTSR